MYDITALTIQVPEPVRTILRTLKQNGFEAYIVGGCVRDAILGLEPKDFDITTSALPEQAKSLFSNTADTGIQHGTVMVILHGIGYEVTTYRIDGEYKDGRHPEQVSFTRSLQEDLKRRDFTINAFAYEPEAGFVDLFDGIGDLNAGLIRCVGKATERFNEDALRIMRAVRFSAQLSFAIEEETKEAMALYAPNLAKVSMERIRVEFEKTLISNQPENIRLYAQLGIDRFIVPHEELVKRCFDPQMETVYASFSGEEEARRILRLACFLHQLSPEEGAKALRLMKYDNKTVRLVTGILRYQKEEIAPEKTSVKEALFAMGEELFDYVLQYQSAFAAEQAGALKQLKAEILAAGEPFAVAHLQVNGRDLIDAFGMSGEQIGKTLTLLLKLVIQDPACNQKETLLSFIANRSADMTDKGN